MTQQKSHHNVGVNNPMYGVHRFGKDAPAYGIHGENHSRWKGDKVGYQGHTCVNKP